MGNFLQKVLSSTTVSKPSRKGGALCAGGKPRLPIERAEFLRKIVPDDLPNASVVYGVGASLLFVRALFLFMEGEWFTGIVIVLIGVCLTGFALHLMKHQD